MNIEDDAYLFVKLPEDIPKYQIPTYLRKSTTKACNSFDVNAKNNIIKLLKDNLHLTSDYALEEAKFICANKPKVYEVLFSDIGINRLYFMYSICISQSIRASALEGLVLLKSIKLPLLNTFNILDVFDLYINNFELNSLTEEVELLKRNKYEYSKSLDFNELIYSFNINESPRRLSSLFNYIAKEIIEIYILMSCGVMKPSQDYIKWLGTLNI